MWPPDWLPGSSRVSPCLLTCKPGPLLSSGLGWIPGQAEWNRFGLCTEDCQARGQAAQPHHNCTLNQGCSKPVVPHTRSARLRLRLWVWTLNTETADSRVPDRMVHLVSRCGAFTQPGESDFGIIRFPRKRNSGQEFAQVTQRTGGRGSMPSLPLSFLPGFGIRQN